MAIDEWWRANRDAVELFAQELATAFARIESAPTVRPPYTMIDGTPVFRILMPRTEHHVYYTVDVGSGEIVVETVWSARRGRDPSFTP